MTAPGLPNPVWTVLGWPSALALCSHGVLAWLRGGRRLLLALLLVWVGIGLSAFLFYAQAWPYPWSGAAWAICFLAVALALLRKTETQELRSLFAPPPGMTRFLLSSALLVWGAGFYLYLSSPGITRLPEEARLSRLYDSDPSCDASELRKLAQQSPMLTAPKETEGSPICQVQWMQVVDKSWASPSGPPCLGLMDGNHHRRHYCVFDFWESPWWARAHLHGADLIVAQTAWGKPSAFLRPRSAFVDYLFSPRGEYIAATDNPDHWLREDVWRCFWLVFWFLVAGGLILIQLIR